MGILDSKNIRNFKKFLSILLIFVVISLKYIEKEEDLAKRGEKSRIIFIINTQTGKLSYALIKIIETVIICAILRQLKCKYREQTTYLAKNVIAFSVYIHISVVRMRNQ